MTGSIAASTSVQSLSFPVPSLSTSGLKDESAYFTKCELDKIFEAYKVSKGPNACPDDSMSLNAMQRLVVPISLLALISAASVNHIDVKSIRAYEYLAKTTADLLVHDKNLNFEQYWGEFTINNDWLFEVERVQLADVDFALDILYDHIDNLQISQRFFEVDCLLSGIEPSKFKVEILLGFLSVTFFYRKQLKTRKAFYAKIKSYLQQVGRYNEALLFGLES